MGLPSSAARQAMTSHWLPPLTSTRGVELRTELDYETLAKVCYREFTNTNAASLSLASSLCVCVCVSGHGGLLGL